jgi:hypothetical protein
MVAGNPAELRQRMINRGLGIEARRSDDADDMSDGDKLLALYRMNADDKRAALNLLSDVECIRISDLMAEDREFAETLRQVDGDAAVEMLFELPDDECERMLELLSR